MTGGVRRICWDRSGAVEVELATPPKGQDPPKVTVTFETQSKRNGNGHKSEKHRSLTDAEKVSITKLFIVRDGRISNEDLVSFKNRHDSFDDISIFQITGWVSVLHRFVAAGKLALKDLTSYEKWRDEKYPGLKTYYDLPEVREVRKFNLHEINYGREPTRSVKKAWILQPKQNGAKASIVFTSGPPNIVKNASRKRTI